jgi:hypothetical protein
MEGKSMSTVSRNEIAEVLDRVEGWPLEDRLSLAQRILGSIACDLPIEPSRRTSGTLADLVGLLKTDGPPPTDEEIKQMLHDERMRRYGS